MTLLLQPAAAVEAAPAPPAPLPLPRSSADPARQEPAVAPHVGVTLVRLGEDGVLLTAGPVLDRQGVADLADELAGAVERGAVRVWLDLSRVARVDGQGVRGLLSLSYRLEARGGGLRLRHARPHVRRAVRWYGAGHLLRR